MVDDEDNFTPSGLDCTTIVNTGDSGITFISSDSDAPLPNNTVDVYYCADTGQWKVTTKYTLGGEAVTIKATVAKEPDGPVEW